MRWLMLGVVPLMVVVVVAVLFARAWLYQIGERSWALSGVLAAALMSTVPALLSRVVGDLVWSTILFGLVVTIGTAVLWRRGPYDAVPHAEPIRLPVGVVILAVFSFVLVAWAALGGHWWDESNCHNGVVTVLARGIVPPVHPLFPTEPFRYHYGFDVLAGIVRAFTSASADDAIDATTFVCFALLLAMAKEIGTAVGGRVGAAMAIVLVPFGGGLLSLFFWGQSGPLEFRWSAIPARWLTLEIPPPVISNFFQHPQGLGMPLSLGVLHIFTLGELRARRLVLGAFMLGALSLAQIVFFGVLGLVLGVVVVYRFVDARNIRSALQTTAALLAALLSARLLGGMLEPGPDVGSVLKFMTTFFTGTVWEVSMLHVVHFGVPLLATLAGLVIVARRPTTLRVALLTGAVIGFAVPNFVTYERSWDIVKFYGVGAFFANALLAGLLADLFKRKQRFLAVTILVMSVFTGFLWIMRMGVLDGRFQIPKMSFPPPSEIGEITAERLEPFLKIEDRVYSTNTDVGLSGGLLIPGFDWRVNGIGYMLDRKVADRLLGHRRAARRDLDARDLDALGVRFLVLSPGDMASLSPKGKLALRDPERFELMFEVEAEGTKKTVFRVVPDHSFVE